MSFLEWINNHTFMQINLRKLSVMKEYCKQKKVIFLGVLIALFSSVPAIAQTIPWSIIAGGNGDNGVYAITSDNWGNVYVAANGTDTIDFDPGPNEYKVYTGNRNLFVAKFTPLGIPVWVYTPNKQTKDIIANDIAVDKDGNVIVVGQFGSGAYFDPSSTLKWEGQGFDNSFILKLAANGAFDWVHAWTPAVTHASNYAKSVETGSFGEIYVGGYFHDEINFKPQHTNGVDRIFYTKRAPSDLYLLRLAPNGDVKRIVTAGSGLKGEEIESIVIDDFNNLIVSGSYVDSLDVDWGTDTLLIRNSSSDINTFIVKIDTAFNYQWHCSFGDSSRVEPAAIKTDVQGNVYTLGTYHGRCDFDPDSNNTFYPKGDEGVFVQKLDSSGQFVWLKSICYYKNSSDFGAYDMAISDSGIIYTTGHFWKSVDFDPGPNEFRRWSKGNEDGFLHQMNLNGDFKSVNTFGYTDRDYVYAVEISNNNDLYIGGQFREQIDLIPGVGEDWVSPPNKDWGDLFFFHLQDCPPIAQGYMTATSCGRYKSPSGRKSFPNSGVYIDTVSTASGCDSLIEIHVTQEINTLVDWGPFSLTAQQDSATYQWGRCSNTNPFQPITGETNREFFPSSTKGTYAVIIDIGSCVDTSNCVRFGYVDTPEEPELEEPEIKVYPNPTNGQLTIEGIKEKEFTVRLVDYSGRTLLNSQNKTQLDISKLPEGVYILFIEHDRSYFHTKIMKM